jgi:LPXTG-motif cell wall-anchored protein
MSCGIEMLLYPLLGLIFLILGIILIAVRKKKKKSKSVVGIILIFLAAYLFLYVKTVCFTSRIIPDQCTFAAGVECINFNISANDGNGHSMLVFTLKNNLEGTTNFNFNATQVADGINTFCALSPNDGVNIEKGSKMQAACIFNQTFAIGDKYRFAIFGNYITQGNQVSTPLVGKIYGEAK